MSTDRTVRLRPHHLLCVLTYGGRGYTAEFVVNLDAVVARLAAGAEVMIVDGADDVCDPMMRCQEHPDFHCDHQTVTDRDRRAAADLGALLLESGRLAPGETLSPGSRLAWDAGLARELRAAFARRTIRAACPGCEWEPRCTERAGGGFAGARLPTA